MRLFVFRLKNPYFLALVAMRWHDLAVCLKNEAALKVEWLFLSQWNQNIYVNLQLYTAKTNGHVDVLSIFFLQLKFYTY